MATNNVIVKLTNVGNDITQFYIYGFNSSNPNISGSITPTLVGRIDALAGFTASFDSNTGYNSIKLVARDTVCFPSSSTILITSTTPPPIFCETNGSVVDVANLGSNRLTVRLNGTPGQDAQNFNIYTYQNPAQPHYISGSFNRATITAGVVVNYGLYPSDTTVIISGSTPCASFRISGSIPAPPANCYFPDIEAVRRGDNGVNVNFVDAPGSDLGPFTIYAYPSNTSVGPQHIIATGITRNQLLSTNPWPSPSAVDVTADRILVANTGASCSVPSKITTVALGAAFYEFFIYNTDRQPTTTIARSSRRISKVEFINRVGNTVNTVTNFTNLAGNVNLPPPISSSRGWELAGQGTSGYWRVKGYVLPGDYRIKIYVSSSYKGTTVGTNMIDTVKSCWIGEDSTTPTWDKYYTADNVATLSQTEWCFTFIGRSSVSADNGGYVPENAGSSGEGYWITVNNTTFNPSSEPLIINFNTGVTSPTNPGGINLCIDPNTNILLTEHGDTKLAGELKVGDTIYTYNYKKDVKAYGYYKIIYHKIEYTNIKMLITFADGSNIIVSNTHNFMLADGTWRQVFDFVGNEIIKGIYEDKQVVSMENVGGGDVVVITVDRAETYISNGVISHNMAVTLSSKLQTSF